MSESESKTSLPEIVIRGAGIIGLSIAWRLLRRGYCPVIFDPSQKNERASWAAAGMLSAQFEALIEPEVSSALRDFSAHSASLWPDFAAELEADSGQSVSYTAGPSLGLLRSDQFDIFASDNRLKELTEPVDDAVLSSIVPGLQADGFQKILFPEDGQVDNRAVLKALLAVCQPFLTHDENVLEAADLLIDCRGWQAPDIRPVKGQMISLRPDQTHPRIPVRWGAAYIVPKPDRTIIGASVEPDQTELDTDDGVIENLLASAFTLLPDMARNAEFLERWAGLRPMARRQRPMIGWQDAGRQYIATGHYRNGILLAPATAELVVDDILGGASAPVRELADLRP